MTIGGCVVCSSSVELLSVVRQAKHPVTQPGKEKEKEKGGGRTGAPVPRGKALRGDACLLVDSDGRLRYEVAGRGTVLEAPPPELPRLVAGQPGT